MKSFICSFLLLVLFWQGAHGEAQYDEPLDHPFTLRNTQPFLLENRYHQLITKESETSFAFPQKGTGPPFASKINFSEKNNAYHLTMTPLVGGEFRYIGEKARTFDLGVQLRGYINNLSFYLDTRMFTEMHDDFNHPSYDREFVERQNEDLSEGLAFSSYSRYRSNVSLNFKYLRVVVARDALHWGPSLYSALMFNQNAIPFNHIRLESSLGPFRVISVYGQLAIDGGNNFRTNSDSRSVYAHRYEWNINRHLLVGVSEQLVLYNSEDPFAFIPIVPLYIAKGNMEERKNNGNIAFDVSYRFLKSFNAYSEFLIDDIMSPNSLFNDFWGNKWGWVAGLHYARNLSNKNISQLGVVTEYSRVEPWVYTHYAPNTSQSANQRISLGNPLGPNSQSLTNKVYLRGGENWYISIKNDLLWKGTDLGSQIQDSITKVAENSPKELIKGISKPEYNLSLEAHIKFLNSLGLEARVTLGSRDRRFTSRIQYYY